MLKCLLWLHTKGKLYVGGVFDSIGGIAANNIACWDGAKWSAPGKGVANCKDMPEGGGVNALTVYNGKLIAAGGFDSAGGQFASEIARWDGSSWSTLGSGIGISDSGWVRVLCVYNNALYVGGKFYSAGGIAANNISQWSEPLSIQPIVNDNEVAVYPNPNNGIFQLRIKNYELGIKGKVEVYNMLGELVKSEELRIKK